MAENMHLHYFRGLESTYLPHIYPQSGMTLAHYIGFHDDDELLVDLAGDDDDDDDEGGDTEDF